MAEVASAFVSLLPTTKGFGSSLERQVGGDLDGAGKRLGSRLGSALKVGALAATAGAFVFAKQAVEEARDAQKVGALTTSIIKSTGSAAGVTAEQVGAMAGRLSNFTGIDDEAIQKGANLLLTFKNVKNFVDGEFVGVFDRANAAAVDLSAAGFGSIEGGAKMLGKALNDPVKGITALSRAGVTFSEDQKATITRLVETGNAAKAQGMILDEVESQVGGAAAASATAGEKAAVAWGNLQEQVGTAMLPAIDAAANAFTGTLAPALSSFIDGVGPAVGTLKDGLTPVVGYVRRIWDAFDRGGATVAALRDTFGGVRDAIASAFPSGGGGGFSALVQSVKSVGGSIAANFLPMVRQAGKVFREDVLPVVGQVVSSFVTNLGPALQAAATTFKTVVLPAVVAVAGYLIRNLWPILQQVWGIIATQVIPIIGTLAKWFYGTLYPAVVKIAVAVGKQLKPVFDAVFKVITNTVLPAVSKLLAKFREWLPTITKVIGVVVKVIGWVLKFAAAILGKVLPPIIRFAGWLIGKLVGALSTVIGWVIKIIGWVVSFGVKIAGAGAKVGEFVAGLKEKFGQAVDWVKGLPGRIVRAIGNLGDLLVDKGKDVVSGLWDGIKGMGDWLADKVLGFARDVIPGPIAKALGISSPSKVMAEQAKWIPLGMAKGIEDNARAVQESMTKVGKGLTVPRVAPDLGGGPVGAGGPGGVHIRVDKVEPHDYRAFMGDMQRRSQRMALGGFPA